MIYIYMYIYSLKEITPYAEKKIIEMNEKSACNGFRPSSVKVSSFIIQKFSRCINLSFNVSIDAMRMFLSCSMIMVLLRFLKS